jgi:hypothetical protein
MGKTDGKHDIAIADASGNEVGLILARDKNGVPIYEEYTSPALADQFFTGAPSYGNTRAEEELRFVQTDYRAGFGLEYADSSDPKRYFTGKNIDARFRDEVRAGPLATSVTMPTVTTYSIANADMELNSDWLTGSGTTQQSSTQAHGGTYSWQCLASSWAYEDIEGVATDYKGRRFKISLWVYSATASTARIGIDDGVGTTYSSYHTGGGSWEQLSVTRTIDASATRLRIVLCNDDATSNSAYFDDATIDGQPTKGEIADQVDFNSERYIIYGNLVCKLNAAGDTFSYVWNSVEVTQLTDLEVGTVSGADYMFVMQGWSDKYWYMDTSESFTQTDLANATLKFMVVDGTTFRGSDTNSTVVSTTNPLAGGINWASSTQIGEDSYDIVDLKMFKGLPYIKKSDCTVHYLDENGNAKVLVSGKANVGGTNTYRMYVWREESLLIPYGKQELLHYDGSTVTHISPALFMNNASDFAGQIQAVTGDDQWLYVVLDNGTKVEVMCGRQETVPDAAVTTDWRWHPLAELTLANCASADITSIPKKRLWVGSTDSSDSFYYYTVTTQYGDIDNDSDYRYASGGEIITPYHHFDLKGDPKSFPKITLTMGHTYDVNIYWEVYYQKLGDSTWTKIGDFKGALGNMVETKYLPNDASGNEPSSRMVRFKFVPITDDSTKTPILLGYDIQGIWYPTYRKLIYCQILVAQDIVGRQGIPDATMESTIRSLLDGLRNPSTAWPRAFYPLYWKSSSDTIYVRALPPTPRMRPRSYMRREGGEVKAEYTYELILQVVPLS